ncbi:unnamed protein product [Urochloa decumbens]|uniref:Uncharacterized protein n=1 Tax=Urochloa decumbens TaxID=240449 RepID=A0ABC9AQ32_9POAL
MDCEGNALRDFLKTNGHVVLQRVSNYNLRSFTEQEIEHITNRYSALLGKGAFGEVYRGLLDDQCLVAVKKYKDGTRKEDLAKEVIVHSQMVNHKNVVRLLGCCTEENALAIVMEFICNGNLADILHRGNGNGHVLFPLDRRLSIAIELAEVLSHMHSLRSPILHGDIKPDNILLNEDFAPRISDFGIARLISSDGTQQTQNIIGSIGYLDPLYTQTGILTPKIDVYSFGVLLVEMITRKKAADGKIYLIQSFNEALKSGKKVRQMFDMEIVDGKKSIKVLDDIAKLAAECLILDNKQRPEMVEVADRLRKCRDDLQLRKRGAMLESSGSKYPINPSKKEQPTQVLATISLDELKEITRNFNYDTLIGQGSHAEVYLGELKDGRKCVVKILEYPDVEELDNEVLLKSISRLEHNNFQLLSYHIKGNVCALVYEYSSRGSLHDILHEHPSLQNAKKAPIVPLRDIVRLRLKEFSRMSRLKRKALRVIADHVADHWSAEEVEVINDMFKFMDTDNDGIISYEQLMNGLAKLGSELGESEVQMFIEAVDTNGSGALQYREFLAVTLHVQRVANDEHRRQAFLFFDKDGNGFIEPEELREALVDDGAADSMEVVNGILHKVDTDKDGKISYDEFVAMMKTYW